MERTRHIRRRYHNRERLRVFPLRAASTKRTFLFPHITNTGFNRSRLKPVVHHADIFPNSAHPETGGFSR
jgi:hypothetical protein